MAAPILVRPFDEFDRSPSEMVLELYHDRPAAGFDVDHAFGEQQVGATHGHERRDKAAERVPSDRRLLGQGEACAVGVRGNLRHQVAFEVEVGFERARTGEHAPDRADVLAGLDHETGEMRDTSLGALVQQPSQPVLQLHPNRAARAPTTQ